MKIRLGLCSSICSLDHKVSKRCSITIASQVTCNHWFGAIEKRKQLFERISFPSDYYKIFSYKNGIMEWNFFKVRNEINVPWKLDIDIFKNYEVMRKQNRSGKNTFPIRWQLQNPPSWFSLVLAWIHLHQSLVLQFWTWESASSLVYNLSEKERAAYHYAFEVSEENSFIGQKLL